MKRLSWKVRLSLGLLLLSAALYGAHYLIYRDAKHIFIYLLGDIAFIPVDVLLVMLVIHGVITAHDKKLMRKKLNMVFGAFFSEAGTELLRQFSACDPRLDELRAHLVMSKDWTDKEFLAVRQRLAHHTVSADASRADLGKLRAFLLAKREFLLRLLENPNLLEHEEFTNLLWSVFHLGEELAARQQVAQLPAKDLEHLSGDITRAYGLLLGEWVSYMRHLRKEYPFLFSLAMRTNPFDAAASAVVR